jgi:DNA-binding MarR family transcriptional regulator
MNMTVSSETARELIEELYLMGRAFRGAVMVTEDGEPLPGGMGVLLALESRGRCRQNELAADLCISQSALSRHITDLVSAGFITRRADPGDGRATQVLITTAGSDLLAHVRLARAKSLQSVLADWEETDAQAAGSAIRKLRSSLTKHAQRADRPAHDINTAKDRK